ncbi:hypothetical protein ACUN24_11235 [Pedobacter sp. WC2501]|uniref:hypothetical protein n=1 Tax=Pedobacter sp. WC2501 TaxID=3461400 RepID=UPI0040454F4A
MKKSYKFLKQYGFALLLLIMLGSCSKEILDQEHLSTHPFSITDAQNFYNQTLKLTAPKLMGNQPLSGAGLPKEDIHPLWNQADTLSDNKYYVVELPVTEDVSTASISNKIDGENVTSLNPNPNGITRLIVVKDKITGKTESALMRLTAYTEQAAQTLADNTYKRRLLTLQDRLFLLRWMISLSMAGNLRMVSQKV